MNVSSQIGKASVLRVTLYSCNRVNFISTKLIAIINLHVRSLKLENKRLKNLTFTNDLDLGY